MQFTKISIIIKPKDKVPYFIGSQLRGALGYALKNVICINPSYQCEGCFASFNCLYYEFYEEKNSFHKYRFDFELGLDYYNFDFYLFDDASTKLPYVISALHKMITQNGLGVNRVTYRDFDMYVNDENILINSEIKIPSNFTKTLEIDDFCQDVRVNFLTPLRMKKNNRFIKSENLETRDIINSIYQRQMKLLGNEHKRFPYEIEGNITSNNLKFKDLTRLSNRQKTTMNMGGLMGAIEIKGLNKETYEVLKLGELIGVGKQTVFGLGKIRVEEIN